MNATIEEAKIPKFMFDSLKSTYESLKNRYEAQEDRIAELERQLEEKNKLVEKQESQIKQKDTRIEVLFADLQWVRKVHYNPTFRPVEKDILITAYDHARTGQETRVFVGSKSKQIGIARNTYGSTLQKLGDFNVIEYRNTEPTRDEKGRINEEVYITFPEELLKNPDEIVIDRGPENRGGNAKEKAAKKACPNCNSIQLEEGKVCYCKNCSHQWEEGKRKDVNILNPDDEMREAANVKKPEVSNDVTDEGLTENMNTLFPEEEISKSEIISDIDPRLPNRACFKCGTQDWEWDDVWDMPQCKGCKK